MVNIEELKAKVLKGVQDADIASLYILEKDAQELFDEDTLHGFYTNILDLALENLTNTLEAHRVMNMQNVQDYATLRALYEYAIEHYSAGSAFDASALFEVLSGISNDTEFSQALKLHTLASAKGLSLDNFLDKIADIDKTEESGTFYISHFTKEAQKLLNDSPEKLGE